MRDHRHNYAVRHVRAVTPAELVARQLGHANAVLVHRVYGRFAPNQQEFDRWERAATAIDAERLGGAAPGALSGAVLEMQKGQPPVK